MGSDLNSCLSHIHNARTQGAGFSEFRSHTRMARMRVFSDSATAFRALPDGEARFRKIPMDDPNTRLRVYRAALRLTAALTYTPHLVR